MDSQPQLFIAPRSVTRIITLLSFVGKETSVNFRKGSSLSLKVLIYVMGL